MDITLLLPIFLGWVAGLFVNYASDVLPVTRHFSQPACPNCQATFSWADYLTLRACRNCANRRSLRTWIVQIIFVASFLNFWLVPPKSLGLILSLIVMTYFGIITVIDLEHRLILHPTSAFGAILGLIAGTYLNSRLNDNGLLVGFGMSLLGGLIGFGVMFFLYKIGELVARIRARKLQAAGQADDEEEALGGGDVYLLGVLGLLLGWPFILNVLVYGVLLGGIVSIFLLFVMLIRRRYASEALMTFIPYGPFFILSAIFVLFLQN
ncbi:MAG TPA: A24 family peptidase [Anaerolineales bacterium]|nr:A24 family peptidase [Anaerolineales bacterium]